MMTKRTTIAVLLVIISISNSYPQYKNSKLPQYPEEWNTQWITHPKIDEAAHNLIHFRNSFELKEIPEQFIVHVSGDNRYRLYVNGKEICYGPQLADIRHWRYESIDLSPFLKKGKNIVAAEVMNWGIDRSYGIISFKTAFLLQGHSENETLLNTGYDSNWKVHQNKSVFEKTVDWIYGDEIVGGFYAANPTDSIVAGNYPWGWKELEYNDEHWLKPEIVFSKPKTNAGAGHGWIMQPRTTAIQTSKKEVLGQVVRTNLNSIGKDYRFGNQPLVIPENSKVHFLIDQKYVTLGYPKLRISKGKNAIVRVKYSEALYDENNRKGNRNVIKGKKIKGISDVYVMDGGENRVFQPMWFRTFRFIRVDIQTFDEQLIINDFHNIFSSADLPVKAKFKIDNPIYEQVWNNCWHCMKICAQDNLLSDAYYEQMQYVGDLRPHLMAWHSLTGDLTFFHSAIEQFNNSRLPDGNITSCYPLKATFVHPTYSLIWIDMLHDLMMLEGNKHLLESYLSEIDEVFDYYESIINKNGLVGKSPYHFFIDWYVPKGGNSPVNKNGNSAILTLNYVYTLNKAAEIVEWLGYRQKAAFYRIQAKKYAEIVRKLCFDKQKNIYADDPEQTFYDQRASILAVLTGAHTKAEQKALMEKILNNQTWFDSKANLFYYFYLFEAMEKTGIGNFAETLQPWKSIVDMGLTATPEKRIEQHPRSEVHPWTAHPVHFYFSVVAGIKPVTPGYHDVRIAPNPGDAKKIDATLPTIKGNIVLQLQFDNGNANGKIILPKGMQGVFVWKNKKIGLKTGENTVRMQ